MRQSLCLWALLLAAGFPALAQVESPKVTIRAILVDKDLNQKPIPRLSLRLTRSDVTGTEPYSARTNFDGTAGLELPPGRYHLSTSDPAEFQGNRGLIDPRGNIDICVRCALRMILRSLLQMTNRHSSSPMRPFYGWEFSLAAAPFVFKGAVFHPVVPRARLSVQDDLRGQ